MIFLSVFALCSTLLFLGYVTAILVPYLRRQPVAHGRPGDFQWHFLVPCRDEEAVIGETLARLLAAYPAAHVWVVDDASVDGTAGLVHARAVASPRVHLVRRRLPDARTGKGAALNAAYRELNAWLPPGLDRSRLIVGVIDADGILGPAALEVVAGEQGFARERVGAVQIAVRMSNREAHRPFPHRGPLRNAVARILIRMQDLEFMTTIAAMQALRIACGSVALGGNGQFTRMRTLDEIAARYGDPWHGSLLEDYELGIHAWLSGWRVTYLHDAYVEQEALLSVRRLIAQRTRWAQGNMQCARYLPQILRSRNFSLLGALESSHFLVLPFVQVLGVAAWLGGFARLIYQVVSGWAVTGVRWPFEAGPGLAGLAGLAALFGVLPFALWGPVYRARYAAGHRWRAGLAWGIANWVYATLVPLCVVRACWRLATGRSGWVKTARNASLATGLAPDGLGRQAPPPSPPTSRSRSSAARPAGARIAVVAGTRPEIIKLAPVVRELGDRAEIIHSGQHYDRELADVFFTEAGLAVPRCRLGGVGGEPRSTQVAAMIAQLGRIWADSPPAAVIVQGDTNTSSAAAQAANYAGIPLVHVEAGLRSYDRAMPEEINRQVVGVLADLHCAATDRNAANLLREGVPADRISVTGNTIVETVLAATATASRCRAARSLGLTPGRFVLATIHRPENADDHLRLAMILRELAGLPVPVVLPLHPRTAARIEAAGLRDLLRPLRVLPPVDHPTFLSLAGDCGLLVSDSGSLQEECTVLKKPLIVVRNSTERPESIEAGFAHLVRPGAHLGQLARHLLADDGLPGRLARIPSPYGDGQAATRICAATLDLVRDRPAAPSRDRPAAVERGAAGSARHAVVSLDGGPARQRAWPLVAAAAVSMLALAAGGWMVYQGATGGPAPLLKPPPARTFALNPALGSLSRPVPPHGSRSPSLPPSCPRRSPASQWRVVIPSLCVLATIKQTRVMNGALVIPPDVSQVGLDADSAALSATRGTTIIAGHINNIDQGEGVFYHLDQARPGAEITVYGPGGSITTWRVYKLAMVTKTALPADIWSTTGPRRLLLVTCGGPLLHYSWGSTYQDNVLVYATPADDAAPGRERTQSASR